MASGKPLCIDLFCGLMIARVPLRCIYRGQAVYGKSGRVSRSYVASYSPSSATHRFSEIRAGEPPPILDLHRTPRTSSAELDTFFLGEPLARPYKDVASCTHAICGDDAYAIPPSWFWQQTASISRSSSADYCLAGRYRSACRTPRNLYPCASRLFALCGECDPLGIGSEMSSKVCRVVLL